MLLWMVGIGMVALLLGAAEWADPEDRDGAAAGRRRHGGPTDVAWIVVHLAYAPVVVLGSTALVSAVWRHGVAYPLIRIAPLWLRLAGATVVAELGAYWLHRAMHAVPALWRLHVVHHGSTDLHWWSAFRFHPVDGALAHTLPLMLAAACGFGPDTLAGYLALAFVLTVLAHADVWVPGRRLAWLVATPAFHRSHHEIGRDDVNFAVVLATWDRLFGTADHRMGERRFGTDAALPTGVARQIAWGLGQGGRCNEAVARERPNLSAQVLSAGRRGRGPATPRWRPSSAPVPGPDR